jgi:Leucine-rich repeat (LRR) protein
MNRIAVPMLAFGLLVAVVPSGCTSRPLDEQGKAIAEIEKLGGKVDRGDTEDGVEIVNLENTQITDADLEYLKGFPLWLLDLDGTQITDAGLEHLNGLKQLGDLALCNTKVTDAGLEHLKGLSQLRHLVLNGTQVTDAGLEHLKGLTQLQKLNLNDTKVTDAGVKDLQQALPEVQISR